MVPVALRLRPPVSCGNGAALAGVLITVDILLDSPRASMICLVRPVCNRGCFANSSL